MRFTASVLCGAAAPERASTARLVRYAKSTHFHSSVELMETVIQHVADLPDTQVIVSGDHLLLKSNDVPLARFTQRS